MDDLKRQRQEADLKQEIRRKAEEDLQITFDSKMEKMERDLKQRNKTIADLEQAKE